MKKLVSTVLALTVVAGCLAGCGSSSSSAAATDAPATDAAATEAAGTATEAAAAAGDFDTTAKISVNSREDGSGTRGAFIELFGVEEKDASGNKVDNTTIDANITNSTSVMMSSVAGNDYGIGYISLGSLNDSVKALQVNGVDATAENVANGTYTVARPFNIATYGDVSEVTQDFIDYIMSAEGQAIVEENGYIAAAADANSFAGGTVEGKIVVAGSSSVSPVMEKLAEAYQAVNTNATVELQTSDSTTGMTSTVDGICDIGMASRELKDTETEAGLTATVIAMDGIAVIVNNNNPITNITSDSVKAIFTGATTTWADVQ